MRAIATALVVICASLVWTVGAAAAPARLTVRIEGREKTLFEGPILSEGHDVRTSSDSRPRHCDGTNNGANPAPAPTPTAAAVDALGLVGQGFDGRWFEGFDDYFVKRLGPDSEDPQASAFWGVLVNGELIPVGGCQHADAPGDEVLWAYDAFNGRGLLRLATTADPSVAPAPPATSAHVELGQPLALEVQSYSGGEGQTPTVKAAAGVAVAPVQTAAGTGFETVEVASPETVTTGPGGLATVSFSSPGWHRLKAQEENGFIRSNRLDVCVEPPGGGGCGALPADAQLRVPAAHGEAPGGEGGGLGPSNAFRLGPARLDRRAGTATLRVAVPGAGRIALAGRQVRAVSRAVAGGSAPLVVRPVGAARAALLRRGSLRVSVRVSFTPQGGAERVEGSALTLKQRSPAR